MNKIIAILGAICAALFGIMGAFFFGKRAGVKTDELHKLQTEAKIIEELNRIDAETAAAGDDDVRLGMREFTKKD